jgi:bifunctional DNA-binding transcriptional regulator/antitoxin component of YhaV-PrlF toxin-antitoxin module
MKILSESTLTSKNQITVPKVVCQLLDLHAGDNVIWSLGAAGRLVVSGGRTNTLEDIRAAVAAAAKPEGPLKTPAGVTIEDLKNGIARAVKASMAPLRPTLETTPRTVTIRLRPASKD